MSDVTLKNTGSLWFVCEADTEIVATYATEAQAVAALEQDQFILAPGHTHHTHETDGVFITDDRKHCHTNNTDQYQVVGNKSQVVSSHDTFELAAAAADAINICDSEFATIDVVNPGNSVSGEFVSTETRKYTDPGDVFGVFN